MMTDAMMEREKEKSSYEWFYFPLYQTVINLEQLAFT